MAIYDIKAKLFDREVIDYEGTVLVDFWAPWCAPCRMMSENIERLDRESDGSLKICKVNIDDDVSAEEPLVYRYTVSSIPTVLLFKNGELKKRIVGLRNVEGLKEMIASI